MKAPSQVELLLALIDQSYDKRAWHGTNLRGSIRGLSAGDVVWRPASDRHNIAEIAVHCAYWKYTVRRRLLREKRGSFVLEGSNWFERTNTLTDRDWKNDIRLLEETHTSMRDAIGNLPAGKLHTIVPGSKWTYAQVVYGIASHDVYHAGQIQLIKRLIR
ncbi:MAG: DinB family protein [Bacteroidota bacterium]